MKMTEGTHKCRFEASNATLAELVDAVRKRFHLLYCLQKFWRRITNVFHHGLGFSNFLLQYFDVPLRPDIYLGLY
jgi:hypothetical protein